MQHYKNIDIFDEIKMRYLITFFKLYKIFKKCHNTISIVDYNYTPIFFINLNEFNRYL